MAYTCDLGSGQRIYLDNVGEQTAIAIASSGPGQQQQSGSQFTTGAWTSPPAVFRTQQGVVIQLHTTQGTHHLQVQGSQMGWMSGSPVLGNAQPMPMNTVAAMPGNTMPPMSPMQPMQPMQPMSPMEPMPPMPPMKMGDMEMSLNPMQMKMGNMQMQMGNASGNAAPKAKFCSQCGNPVQPSDRFCANCGHQLNG